MFRFVEPTWEDGAPSSATATAPFGRTATLEFTFVYCLVLLNHLHLIRLS
jgi:hypothetical protein